MLSVEEWKVLVLQKVGQYRVRDDVFMRRVFKDDTPLAQLMVNGAYRGNDELGHLMAAFVSRTRPRSRTRSSVRG